MPRLVPRYHHDGALAFQDSNFAFRQADILPLPELRLVRGEISIRRLTRHEWDSLAPLFRGLSYRQCGSYDEVAAADVHATCEFVAVIQSAKIIGLASVRVKMVPLSRIGIAYLDRGPLIGRDNEFSAETYASCLDALKKVYVQDRHLMLRVVPPNVESLENPSALFATLGFKPSDQHKPRETFILDLRKPLPEIRKSFDRKWRNHLSKAERSEITVTRSVALSDFTCFESLFLKLATEKGFTAPQDVAFFRGVQERAQTYEQLVLHLAWCDGELIAGHLGSFVGNTAVYLLGANTAKGRELRASYLLQWAVIQHAKSVGNLFYDLGGIDQQENPNVYHFKKRLNGRRVTELGAFEIAPSSCGRMVSAFAGICLRNKEIVVYTPNTCSCRTQSTATFRAAHCSNLARVLVGGRRGVSICVCRLHPSNCGKGALCPTNPAGLLSDLATCNYSVWISA